MNPHGRDGFTLVELLLACVVTAVILLLTAQAFTGSSSLWRHSAARGETFGEARAAAEIVARDLQALLPAPEGGPALPMLGLRQRGEAEPGENEELYLATVDAGGGLALVGYRVVWNPQRHCYALRRFLKNGAEARAALAAAGAEGGDPFEAFYSGPWTADEEVAGCVWDFTVRPCENGEPGPYPRRYWQNGFPRWVEIRFKALGPSAAARATALPLTVETWHNPQDPLFERAILPFQQAFSFRVPLLASPTP